jgi:mono/diheme cytochrome c family protein
MKLAVLALCLMLPEAVLGQDRDFALSAPQKIRDSTFLQYLLPRFSLKHGVRINVVDADADAVIGDTGTAVFAGFGQVWHLSHNGGEGPALFADWLLSDIGKRTVEGFTVDGDQPFSARTVSAVATPEILFNGDVEEGSALALRHCGRCHVVNESNRMKGMGQTPSFALMRTFTDWQNRFAGFYALNPHPSFTQVAGITPPFDPMRPPAIFPLEMTQDDLDAILAYVATIVPADLGAPLQSQ